MRIMTIKSFKLDSNGFKWLHKTTTKIFKNKQIATETIGSETNALYKRVTDGKTVKEFDKGLFGEWIERKKSE